MYGEDDLLAPPSAAAVLAQGIRNSTLCAMAGWHLFNVENQELFAVRGAVEQNR